MKNPDYHPDKAHLPNDQDKKNWRNGGKAKHEREQLRVRATIERFNRNK